MFAEYGSSSRRIDELVKANALHWKSASKVQAFFLHLRNLLETSLGNNFPPELRLSKRVSDMLFLFLVSVTKLSPSAGLGTSDRVRPELLRGHEEWPRAEWEACALALRHLRARAAPPPAREGARDNIIASFIQI